ncbi:hypothetical protein BJ170DRAFT_588182 [Xylariales sp. AK1849]|nr:hypothetical protein BJ170DRAFT_588182 [Xylariales sp. AK1849]
MSSQGSVDTADAGWKTLLTITVFCAIALYNVVELNIITFNTFKRRSGLYFWSFLIAVNGIAPCAIGFILKDHGLSPSPYLDVTLIIVGWMGMVTGQSVVLYSRLHLVMHDRTRLRLVLSMIIVNAIICHIPTSILIYGANSPNPHPWDFIYNIYEKIEVTIFFVQELILSGCYIYSTISFFRLAAARHGKSTSQMMTHLVWINIVIILADVTILGLEYASFYSIQTAYKCFVYSVKLKLEFRVLNALIDLAKSRRASSNELGAGAHHCYWRAGDEGIYDGTGHRGNVVDFDTFKSSLNRSRDDGKGDGAESCYDVRIYADDGGNDAVDPAGITVMTTTEVSTSEVAPWATTAALENEEGDLSQRRSQLEV